MDVWGTAPQWITLAVALGAGVIAVINIFSQRQLARKRAAYDIFLKTETDLNMLNAYDHFHDGIAEMKKANTIQEFCTAERTRKQYLYVRKYLNVHELIAVGIEKKVLDHDLCYMYWGDALMNGYSDAKPVLDFLAARPKNKYTYSELRRLNTDWVKRKENAHLASSASNS
jgi:hypothetical protein